MSMFEECVIDHTAAPSEGASWDKHFSDPILTDDGVVLETLRDAGAYISRLPDTVYRSEPWRAATHMLIEAAEGAASIELARFAIGRALALKAPDSQETT
ncbi:hypothetical protein AB7783_12140 [Tardiphaga sp. 172_B4_N1_3]|uniref:hypothetical protein n=1 Tax=Tardiphaga sp. 172_B4_N1_3 TaxID=3240787 RepID=UPI003F8AE363